MNRALLSFTWLFACLAVSTTWAQSTISDQPWEVTSNTGLWTAFLPSYELGTNANGAVAFRDNLDDVGYRGEYKVVRRFLGTRTSFETKAWFASADSVRTTGPIDVSIPHPTTGAANPFTGGRTHLKSETDHYGIDVALRDTWRTAYGGLSAGAAFSYMAFDQSFQADYGANRLLNEDLDTDYVGGKAIFGWDGCFRGNPAYLDFAVGYFDMDTDYRFVGGTLAGGSQEAFTKNVTSLEIAFTTRRMIRGYQVGTTIGLMHLTDLATIVHPAGAPAFVATGDATLLTTSLEFLW